MPAFAIIPAALTGFRLTREQPRALLLWAGVALAVSFVDAAVTQVTGAQGAANRLQALQIGGAPDVAAALAILPRLAPALAVSFVLSLGMGAVLLASVFRAELGQGRRVTLALGRDEGRMALALAALFAVQLAAALPVGLIAGLAAAARGGMTAGVLAISQAVMTLLTGVLMVRLALAPPAVVAEHRLALAESWRRTRGRFWPLLLALVAAAGLAMLVVLLANFAFMMLVQAALTATGQGASGLQRVFIPAGEGWSALVAPGVLASRVFGAVLVALVLPILAGPVAAAYAAFGEPVTPASDDRSRP